MKTFNQIATAQGWDMETQINILRDFVATTEEMLTLYAERIAAEENGLPDPVRQGLKDTDPEC